MIQTHTHRVQKKAIAGFTLIELMIVVAIIGILAAVAIPKFADLLKKAKEGATKGKLGSVRSALSIYYGDAEGSFPESPNFLTINGTYMNVIPAAAMPPYHAADKNFDLNADENDGGGWTYNNVATDANWGELLVNCTHTDAKGAIWTTY